MKFYPRDYLYDTRILTLEERGAWMDLLCFMWNAPERGKLIAHPQQLAQMVGLEWGNFQVILDALERKGVTQVSRLSNGDVTLVSRRMSRDDNALRLNADRQERFRVANVLRQKRAREKSSNASVTAKIPEAKIPETIKDKDLTTKIHQGFIKPTISEISSYCQERGNSVDPNRFFDFYESKGWMIGKNKVKDWRACVRTWERNQGGFDGQQRTDGARNQAIGENERADSKFSGLIKTIRVGGSEEKKN